LSVSSPATFYAGSYDGRVTAYSAANGETTSVGGDIHSNQVSGLTTAGGKVISVGYDDRVREIEGTKMRYVFISSIPMKRGSDAELPSIVLYRQPMVSLEV